MIDILELGHELTFKFILTIIFYDVDKNNYHLKKIISMLKKRRLLNKNKFFGKLFSFISQIHIIRTPRRMNMVKPFFFFLFFLLGKILQAFGDNKIWKEHQ